MYTGGKGISTVRTCAHSKIDEVRASLEVLLVDEINVDHELVEVV